MCPYKCEDEGVYLNVNDRSPRHADKGARCALILALAEGEGFEPPDPCRSSVFKTDAIDHSANLPYLFSCVCPHSTAEHIDYTIFPLGLSTVCIFTLSRKTTKGFPESLRGTLSFFTSHRDGSPVCPPVPRAALLRAPRAPLPSLAATWRRVPRFLSALPR